MQPLLNQQMGSLTVAVVVGVIWAAGRDPLPAAPSLLIRLGHRKHLQVYPEVFSCDSVRAFSDLTGL